jgi:hypothetical protein
LEQWIPAVTELLNILTGVNGVKTIQAFIWNARSFCPTLTKGGVARKFFATPPPPSPIWNSTKIRPVGATDTCGAGRRTDARTLLDALRDLRQRV